MASLSQAKILGGVGAILVIIPVVGVIGYFMIIAAAWLISDYLQERSIFNNVLIAGIVGSVGLVAGGIVIIGVVGARFLLGPSTILGILTGLLIGWVALIASAIFLRRAYVTMADRLGEGLFKAAGTVYLVGAALTIVFIGFLVLLLAELLQAAAYFSIPEQPLARTTAGWTPGPVSSPDTSASSSTPVDGRSKFCTNCGSRIAASAAFCYNCGAKQP